MLIEPVARFRSPFTSKFGIPKQSGLVEELEGTIIFEPKYRNADALRGIDGFDFLWLIWGFSANKHTPTSPVVRPPVLGGNRRVGVFATRSPFRPNALGLSSVRLKEVIWESPQGPVVHVTGADLMNDTPIYDIKPYVTYADCHPHARSGFVDSHPMQRLHVVIPDGWQHLLGTAKVEALRKVLELDPRPHYHADDRKLYGMPFEGFDIHFRVQNGTVIVEPCPVTEPRGTQTI